MNWELIMYNFFNMWHILHIITLLFVFSCPVMSNSFVTPWIGFPRQEYWSELPFPSSKLSFLPRNWTHVSWQHLLCCRHILYCWTTEEALYNYIWHWGFPFGSAGKESACNVGHLGSIPGLGRSPREGKGYLRQHSGLESSMDCIVHGVTKSWTRPSDFPFQVVIVLLFFQFCSL